jgi:hypothetical protein
VEKVTGTHSTTEASKDIHLGQSVVYIITSTILSYCSMISTATVYYSCRQRKYCNGYINNKELQSYNECQISSILSNNESSSHFKSKRNDPGHTGRRKNYNIWANIKVSISTWFYISFTSISFMPCSIRKGKCTGIRRTTRETSSNVFFIFVMIGWNLHH